MSEKIRRNSAERARGGAKKARKQKDKGWEERLRLVGDARFVEVAWSGRDNPSWPLPRK
jgi:hypothetical protein